MTRLATRSAATAPLHSAKRLARQLLVGRSVVEAFEAFVECSQRAHHAECGGYIAAIDQLRAHYRTPHPAPYFFELLAAQSDRAHRKKHGVYFTPGPVVEFILRRVEELVPAGPVTIVDPACGGGVFLLAAAELVRRRPASRLLGFDVSADAVAITRRSLDQANVPAQVECVNPLLAGEGLAKLLDPGEGTLVVLGNPPYANYGRLNRGAWIDGLLADYRRGLSEQKLNLTDDFIKFLRWGQHWIDRAGRGVLAMITSRTYLTGVTHRGMRRSLAASFPRIEIVDLHGDGEPADENIFPIRRGVAMGVFARAERAASLLTEVRYASLRGSRDEKLDALERSKLAACSTNPTPPQWMFVPSCNNDGASTDYLAWPRLDEIFGQFISGVQTKNDALFVDFDREVLIARMQEFLGGRGSRRAASDMARQEPRPPRFDIACVRPYVVGPLDRRWVYYDRRLIGRARCPVMRHMLEDTARQEPRPPRNVGLVFMRQSTGATYDHALVVDTLCSDRVFYSRRGAPFLAPLSVEGQPNFQPAWLSDMADRLGVEADPDDLLGYIYAVLHGPSYRRSFLPELQRDFPRIPMPNTLASFEAMARLGRRLVERHLGVATPAEDSEVRGIVVERGYPRLVDGELLVNRSVRLWFDPAVWDFQIGGYRVIERWLKVRRGRALSDHDLGQLQWLMETATVTRQIAAQIEEEAANAW